MNSTTLQVSAVLHPASISVSATRIPIRGLNCGLFKKRNNARTERQLYTTGRPVQSLLMKQEKKEPITYALPARQWDTTSRIVLNQLMKKDANKTKHFFFTSMTIRMHHSLKDPTIVLYANQAQQINRQKMAWLEAKIEAAWFEAKNNLTNHQQERYN